MWPFERKPAPAPSTSRADIETLATYNSEVARGLMHHVEWHARMAALQKQFDERSSKGNAGPP